MSKKIALALVLASLAVSACAKKEPEVIAPVPVTTEPVYQGKYGAN
ncbi:hypothetical protein [Paracoccus ravus]|nr:hypothetical protein [Paracoccus ravus]